LLLQHKQFFHFVYLQHRVQRTNRMTKEIKSLVSRCITQNVVLWLG